MSTRKRPKLLWISLGILASLLIILGIFAGRSYMNYQQEKQEQIAREHRLYKRGFRLLEEQIAIYAKDHYEGINRIEFSPIFEDGGDYSMYTLDMVPVIYDNYGNRAILGRQIGKVHHKSYGLYGELTLDFDGGDGSEVIVIKKLDTGEEVDVSDAQHLPKEAEVDTYSAFDENIEDLVHTGKLKGIKKSDQGSPNAKVTYNTEIRRGDYREWR